MGKILIGTASWTDKTLLQSGFYPKQASSAEARLRFYSSTFPIVEVDSTYYFPPTERNVLAWINRTPTDFTFHIKAYSLLTHHPTRPDSIYSDLMQLVPADQAGKHSFYAKNLPEELVDECWRRFSASLFPLHSSGKLGVVHFQFPEWFLPGSQSRDYVTECRDRLPKYRVAVEFRNATWLNDKNAERTLDFLTSANIPITSVDMPQGFASSMPPMAAETSKDLAYVRFHGRNVKEWKKPHATATPRFAYNYSHSELAEWVPKIKELAAKTKQVHILMNNCYSDYAVNNARELAEML